MIRLNLTQRIWLSFVLLLFTIGLTTAIIYPLSIKDTLTEETYRIIENEQENIIYKEREIPKKRSRPASLLREETRPVQ